MHAATTIHKHIKNAKKVLIVPHPNPDGDAMGSAAAFFEYVRSFGVEATIFCATPPSPKLNFISRYATVYSDPEIFNNESFDTIVALDSGDLRYLGIEKYVENHPATLINIDHHATNENFGDINLVIPTAASTTEILFRFFRQNGIRITQKMATCLLTGLSTDTGNFTNSATTGDALRAGGELILSGGNFNLITTNTLKNKSIKSLQLWGKAFSRLTKDERQNLTYTYITQDDIKQVGASESEYEGISNFLNNLENTSITLLLTETTDGKVKGSLRTTRHDVDVSEIAKKFGGGGHKKAAGFTTDGTIEGVLGKILIS
jgi:phosphoesterase RecJ-like protein